MATDKGGSPGKKRGALGKAKGNIQYGVRVLTGKQPLPKAKKKYAPKAPKDMKKKR